MKIKRITATLLALLASLSLTSFAGCGDKNNDNSQNNSVPVENYTWGEWELIKNPTCIEDGEKKRVDLNDNTHFDTAAIPARGHEYGNDGNCVRCQTPAVIPALTGNEKFSEVTPCEHTYPHCGCEYTGNGTMWNRIELNEGCFTVELNQTKLWLSFSAKSAGQYALYTVDNNNGASITRHNANEQYVNEKGIAAIEKNENLYSYVNCSTTYYNNQWRATYCISGSVGDTVKLCFVRIDNPAWEPISIRTKVYPTQINGKKAEEVSDDLQLSIVPYTNEYFFDESVGYYRMGTKTEPKEIIYAAISKTAERLLGENSFTTVLKTSGTALNLANGTTVDGDYNLLCYTPFIMNWKDENAVWGTRPGTSVEGSENTSGEPEGDPTKNCYQNFCNSDGVYPVTQELYDFLNLYVSSNRPVDESLSSNSKAWWLSACYYYTEIPAGTEDKPILLTEGDNTLSIPAFENVYYTITEAGVYTISCSTANVEVSCGTNIWTAPFEETVIVTADTPIILRFYAADYMSAVSGTISVTKQQIY